MLCACSFRVFSAVISNDEPVPFESYQHGIAAFMLDVIVVVVKFAREGGCMGDAFFFCTEMSAMYSNSDVGIWSRHRYLLVL